MAADCWLELTDAACCFLLPKILLLTFSNMSLKLLADRTFVTRLLDDSNFEANEVDR